jgi:hypothetical protein
MRRMSFAVFLVSLGSCSNGASGGDLEWVRRCWTGGSNPAPYKVRAIGLAPDRLGDRVVWVAKSDRCLGLSAPLDAKSADALGQAPRIKGTPFKMAILHAEDLQITAGETPEVKLSGISKIISANQDDIRSYYSKLLQA